MQQLAASVGNLPGSTPASAGGGGGRATGQSPARSPTSPPSEWDAHMDELDGMEVRLLRSPGCCPLWTVCGIGLYGFCVGCV